MSDRSRYENGFYTLFENNMDKNRFAYGLDFIVDHHKDYDLIIFSNYNFVARIKTPVIYVYSSMLISLEDQDYRNIVKIQNRIDNCVKFGGNYVTNYGK